jgi:hypothetical protein
MEKKNKTCNEEYEVGKFFNVPTAKLSYGDKIYFVPVIDHKHKDIQLGVDSFHYHIDGRFHIDKAMCKYYHLKDGNTLSVINAEEPFYGIPKFLEIEYKNKKCVRLHTGLGIPSSIKDTQFTSSVDRFNDFYKSFEGHSCKGKRCPHYGAKMMVQGNKLVCPMHGLEGNPETETIMLKQIIIIPTSIADFKSSFYPHNK